MQRVQKSGLKCFDEFLKTLEHWWEEITNYFIDRANSGFVEGLNNKLKVLKRRCYGIFNRDHLFQRIYLDLGRLSFIRLATTICGLTTPIPNEPKISEKDEKGRPRGCPKRHSLKCHSGEKRIHSIFCYAV